MTRRLAAVCLGVLTAIGAVADAADFRVGFAKRDVTPSASMPLWGYGARHDALSDGVVEPLFAKAIVIEAGGQRLAIMGTDLGRGPTRAMMKRIRKQLAQQAGIENVMICGSHTHHGPVIEMIDEEGLGKGRFDAAVAYAVRLEELLIQAIVEAKENLQPARIGIGNKDVPLNRNRHTKQSPPATDPMLAVMRFDSVDGKPLAVLVNYAAHPTTIRARVLKFSPDYPGYLQRRVESALNTNCVFMQGAAGDMAPNTRGLDTQGYGEKLGDQAVALAESIETKTPKSPSIETKIDRFNFPSRIDFSSQLVVARFHGAFFPEFANHFLREVRDGIRPEMTTVLLNGEVALVGASGELFCNHAKRLRERAYVPHTLFFGYCNEFHFYFPTIEAASEGGYGGDELVAWAQVGAGEQMMDRALLNIYTMLGKFPKDTVE